MLGVSPFRRSHEKRKQTSNENQTAYFKVAIIFRLSHFLSRRLRPRRHRRHKPYQIWIKCFMININNGIAALLAVSTHIYARSAIMKCEYENQESVALFALSIRISLSGDSPTRIFVFTPQPHTNTLTHTSHNLHKWNGTTTGQIFAILS